MKNVQFRKKKKGIKSKVADIDKTSYKTVLDEGRDFREKKKMDINKEE